MSDSFITLTLRTAKSAPKIVECLNNAGIETKIEKMPQNSDVRIKVRESEAADAIRILEAFPEKLMAKVETKILGTSASLLVPIDFSDSSSTAVKIAFSFAHRLGLTPILLHTYIAPSLKDTFIGSDDAASPGELAEVQMGLQVKRDTIQLMDKFSRTIKENIKEGFLPDIKFSSIVEEGVPEDVIINYCRQFKPSLVVMMTRNISRREEEMVGSVTAEVADSCRVPLLVIPDTYKKLDSDNISSTLFLSNLNQKDFVSMDLFQRYFGFPETNIFVMPVSEQKNGMANRLEAMLSYFNATYTSSKFIKLNYGDTDIKNQIKKLEDLNLGLVIVPDKKRNIFTRLFRPSIPHRILFEKDVPMLVVPV